jgi:hypothetical protein
LTEIERRRRALARLPELEIDALLRAKAAKWADQGVELVDGDWKDATAIAAALVVVFDDADDAQKLIT